jgi:hypothetical protein
MKHYVIYVWRDVEPQLHGPFPSDESQIEAAKLLDKVGAEGGLFWLDIEDDVPTIGAFDPLTFGEMDDGKTLIAGVLYDNETLEEADPQ